MERNDEGAQGMKTNPARRGKVGLTNRERFVRAMHFEPVDHPPFIMAGPWPDTWERWYREG